MIRRLASFSSIIVLLCSASVAAAAETPVDFARDVAPLVERHCIRCHQPGIEKGGLSLATVDGLHEMGYVEPGDPDSSYVLDLVVGTDGEAPEMPRKGDPLSAAEVDVLRRWIAEGAVWPKEVVLRERSKADGSWWSLQPIADVDPPSPTGLPDGWTGAIDRFVFAELQEQGLEPNPPADRRALLRRVTFDLTGLPPTPEELEAFLDDESPDAYVKVVDRLLDSSRYGERWGRHWLDVVRFGESNGFERNQIINDLWPFRDYVVRSLNEDKPFDRFIREHIAGDVIAGDDPNVAVGSAFLVAGPYDDVGNQDPVQAAQIRANTIDEMIRSTGEAFLGLTVGCARCHDHKFDPIRQRDYYAWYATFAGTRHGSRELATSERVAERAAKLRPLELKRNALTKQRDALRAAITKRANENAAKHAEAWTRGTINRRGTEERFEPVETKFVRLVSEGQDANPNNRSSFGIDEFEVWTVAPEPRNVALAANGGKATGASRRIEDFPGAYGPHLAIDGKVGARFLATAGTLTIELAEPTVVDRVKFSSARGEQRPEHRKFAFVGEYRIEVSVDGKTWSTVATSHDRKPPNAAHRNKRLFDLEITTDERNELAELNRDLATVQREIGAIPAIPRVWVGTHVDAEVRKPFHVFIGGSPQRPGDAVELSSPVVLRDAAEYELPNDASEADRRRALADWLVDPANPLPPRVLANRVWHYHFGTGIVSTPSDFGYMGGKPSHPELLDWLARRLLHHGWRLKPLHREIVLSSTYRQSSAFRESAAKVDGDARLLWRFPPRRLSAEELRDSMLLVSGKLDTRMGGPGFRLYRYLQDNVATYVPLDEHGSETYRRAVYHQNARAARTDLMTEFDQPDCAFSTPRRSETTTPLQALTLLNHDFTLDMASFLAERIGAETVSTADHVDRAFLLCFGRSPGREQRTECIAFVEEHGLPALCRVLLNTSEFVHVD